MDLGQRYIYRGITGRVEEGKTAFHAVTYCVLTVMVLGGSSGEEFAMSEPSDAEVRWRCPIACPY